MTRAEAQILACSILRLAKRLPKLPILKKKRLLLWNFNALTMGNSQKNDCPTIAQRLPKVAYARSSASGRARAALRLVSRLPKLPMLPIARLPLALCVALYYSLLMCFILLHILQVCFSLIHILMGGRALRKGLEFGQGLQKFFYFYTKRKQQSLTVAKPKPIGYLYEHV